VNKYWTEILLGKGMVNGKRKWGGEKGKKAEADYRERDSKKNYGLLKRCREIASCHKKDGDFQNLNSGTCGRRGWKREEIPSSYELWVVRREKDRIQERGLNNM